MPPRIRLTCGKDQMGIQDEKLLLDGKERFFHHDLIKIQAMNTNGAVIMGCLPFNMS